jgi:spermidine/putrescine transport system substrate-binding protein
MKHITDRRLQALRERYGNGDLDRRTFLGLAAALAATTGLGARWIGPALAAVTEVRFDGWGGVVQEAIDKYALQPFTKKTGVKVVQGTFGDESEIITKVKTSSPGDYQIIHSSGVEYYKRYADGGFLTEINEANIPNLKLVMPAMIEPFRKVTPKLSCAPYDYGTTGIAYNTTVISEAEAKEKGANLLIDPKYKDKVGGYGDMVTRVWYGALQSGQNPNDIKDIDAVWGKVRESRDLAKKYWGSGAELMDLLAKGEIVVTDAWSGRIAALQQRGPPDRLSRSAEQLCLDGGYAGLKGAPMAECEQLIASCSIRRRRLPWRGQEYPPALDPGKVQMTEEERSCRPSIRPAA